VAVKDNNLDYDFRHEKKMQMSITMVHHHQSSNKYIHTITPLTRESI